MADNIPITMDDLMTAILALLPHAEIGEDLDGQIIIYTNLSEAQHGELLSFGA